MMASSRPVSRWRVRGEEQRSDGSCIMQPFTVSNIQQYSRLRPTAAPLMLCLESNVIISTHSLTHSLTHWLLPALLTRSFLLVCVSYFVICADRAASVSSVHTLQCNQLLPTSTFFRCSAYYEAEDWVTNDMTVWSLIIPAGHVVYRNAMAMEGGASQYQNDVGTK